MKKEEIGDFTRRITQSNRSQLIVILYEMLEVYLRDAEEAQNYEDFKLEIRSAQKVIYNLRSKLNYKYQLSQNLDVLYEFMYLELERCIMRYSKENLPRINGMVGKLHDAFQVVARKDNSGAMMENTQQVYVGLTYGRGQLYEATGTEGGNRGFLA